MQVVKRDGRTEPVSFDKILKRLNVLAKREPSLDCVDTALISQKVIQGMFDGIHTHILDTLSAETAVYMQTSEPQYSELASRIIISDMHKQTDDNYQVVLDELWNYIHPKTGEYAPIIAKEIYDIMSKNMPRIMDTIKYSRDYNYTWFAYQTLKNAYLKKINGKIVERPQHMLMRVSFGIHKENVKKALETYEYMSTMHFIHATPTLFNAGTPRPQMSSCFLLTMIEDSIEGIYETLKRCAMISKDAGGIGLNVHKIRASTSYIRGTGGNSNGLVPMLRVYNDTARYVDQCFAYGTDVYTPSGPQKIEDTKIGDTLLNSKGKLCKVERVLEYSHAGNILCITTEYDTKGVMVTPEHQVLVLALAGEYGNDLSVKNYLSRELVRTEMKDAKDLKEGDFVCFPVPKSSKHNPYKKCVEECLKYNSVMYSKITNICWKRYVGSVYDFEVSGDHTYVTALGVVHNGGGKRKGAFAVYLEPWHADIFEFLELKKPTGKEENRARDLFYGLWIPDEFMRRVEADEEWHLFCPDESPGLSDCWGDEFVSLYNEYVSKGKYRKVVNARDVWTAILNSQPETGTPYMLYKDECNRRSNQSNLGTIKCSNLCTEIIEYSDPKEIAVCNLASVNLSSCVVKSEESGGYYFSFEILSKLVSIITVNLNKIIDEQFYVCKEAKKSNMRHRPIGIGVQGLADVFFRLRYPYESPAAKALNRRIFETMYHTALSTSCYLAEKYMPYTTFEGSPASKGILQFDMCDIPKDFQNNFCFDWDALKKRIKLNGLRNSLVIALMPTASTSNILGQCESFDPIPSNIFTKRVLAGDAIVINQHLAKDLKKLGLYTRDIIDAIIACRGSVQDIICIPPEIKEIYKTAYEIKTSERMIMAKERGWFVDQSQSFSLFVSSPTYDLLSSIHFGGWKMGLKTGMYYLRREPEANPYQITIDKEIVQEYISKRGIEKWFNKKDFGEKTLACTFENVDCVSCSS